MSLSSEVLASYAVRWPCSKWVKDEGGLGDAADLAGADGDVLQVRHWLASSANPRSPSQRSRRLRV